MRVVQEPDSRVNKLWGIQKPKTAEYRLMKYVLATEVDDIMLLYNVVTAELLELDQKEKEMISELPCVVDSIYNELIHKHFLVPVDFDEFKSVNQLRALGKATQSRQGITGYTILPTTHCNARCFYCYEADMKHEHMSEETGRKVCDFIENNCRGKSVRLLWFGGEPTVGMQRIDQICNGLQSKNIEYSSSMISNGLLFNEKTVDKAVELWRLKFIQITLDGTEKIYNKVKAYVTGETNPFKTVLHNIELFLKAGIRVSIRLNLDKHNSEDLKKLIILLKEKLSGYSNCNVYVHMLFDDEGFEPICHSEREKEELVLRELELNSELSGWVASGKRDLLPRLVLNSCIADGDAGVIIHPDGHLAKCEHFLEESFGTVDTSITNLELVKEYKQTVVYEECRDCAVFPGCIKLKVCPETTACDESRVNSTISRHRDTLIQVYSDWKAQ